MFNGLLRGSEIPARKPALPPLLDRSFALGFQEKRTDERHKGHRDEQGRQQRTTNDDRQTVQEFPCISGQQQKWKIGNDIRDGGKRHRFEQLCRSQPRGDGPWLAGAQFAHNCVAGHHRYIDQ